MIREKKVMDDSQRRYAPISWPESPGITGRNPVECLAGFAWNGWPESVEYAGFHGINPIVVKEAENALP